jgi:hypothetical protein
MRISTSMLLLFILLLAMVGMAQAVPSVHFTQPDTAVCQRTCWNPQISAVVAGLDPDQTINLQLTWQIINPAFLANEKVYSGYDNVGNGEYPLTPALFGVQCLWPGIPAVWVPPNTPDDQKVVEIHFGANLLDTGTGNPLPDATGGQDYYWYPWFCNQVPEFPTVALPVVLIIGFLGAVLFIQRSREK